MTSGGGGVQAEKELSEVNLQLESLHERLEEADGLSSAQVAIATHSHLSHHHHCESCLSFLYLSKSQLICFIYK